MKQRGLCAIIDASPENGSPFMPEPVVRFRGVNKSYGRASVLRGIDLDVFGGQSLGLAGVNGAGKTTLIKCLLDFCALDAGTIDVHGVSHRRPKARARLAFLPERFTPPYFLTGREFISMMLRLFGRPYEESRIRAAAAALDLDHDVLERPVRAYSKGMTQKLGLAACLLAERDLYVFDEPMSGLDPKARARVRDLLLGLKAEGRTLLMTSHSLADIEEICDGMAVLHEGTLVYSGPPQGLRERHGESSLERAFLSCVEARA
jgi:ABC-2 type transport system ATP-binding protein